MGLLCFGYWRNHHVCRWLTCYDTVAAIGAFVQYLSLNSVPLDLLLRLCCSLRNSMFNFWVGHSNLDIFEQASVSFSNPVCSFSDCNGRLTFNFHLVDRLTTFWDSILG